MSPLRWSVSAALARSAPSGGICAQTAHLCSCRSRSGQIPARAVGAKICRPSGPTGGRGPTRDASGERYLLDYDGVLALITPIPTSRSRIRGRASESLSNAVLSNSADQYCTFTYRPQIGLQDAEELTSHILLALAPPGLYAREHSPSWSYNPAPLGLRRQCRGSRDKGLCLSGPA
jgi:hypothetical protein